MEVVATPTNAKRRNGSADQSARYNNYIHRLLLLFAQKAFCNITCKLTAIAGYAGVAYFFYRGYWYD